MIDKGKVIVDINVAVFVAIIVNYVAVSTAFAHNWTSDNPHHVLFLWLDNLSAHWVSLFCMPSSAGSTRTHLLCGPIGLLALKIFRQHLRSQANNLLTFLLAHFQYDLQLCCMVWVKRGIISKLLEVCVQVTKQEMKYYYL